MSNTYTCREARLEIGGDPHTLGPALSEHLATCAACTRFRSETLALDARLRSAMELPLAGFRKPVQSAPPARRFALAASVLLGILVGGGFWLLKPTPALAGDVLAHVKHESASWDAHEVLTPSELAGVLKTAGVQFDSSMPIVYAMACPFRGRRVPHLVVQTADGPVTVMLLAHEKVSGRQEFSEGAYRGILLPAGEGSVAVLARDGKIPEAVAAKMLSDVRW
ncbi:MAG TPA: DUF3379 family protein [Steroidobacteraceae bacterium]|nr:DUF3379 family protein [Steroidobacteraceae bacterium]